VPGHTAAVTLRGRIDTGLRFDDGSGGICDFKTSSPKSPHIALYSRQLHAYALCLENATSGKLAMKRVSRLGLLVFEPLQFKQRPDDGNEIRAFFGGALKWIDIARNDNLFFSFLAEVVSVLETPQPPCRSANCPYCAYRERRYHVME
jgi:hypothetical protein